MLKNIVASVVIGVASFTGVVATEAAAPKQLSSQSSHLYCQELKVVNGKVWRDVFYMYASDKGTYWLDPQLPPGYNVTYIDDRSIARWGIEKSKLRSGWQHTGVYDQSGRVLLKVKL